MTNATSALLMTWPFSSLFRFQISKTQSMAARRSTNFWLCLAKKSRSKAGNVFEAAWMLKVRLIWPTHINHSNAPEIQLIAVIRVTFDSDLIRRKLIAVINPFQFCHPFRWYDWKALNLHIVRGPWNHVPCIHTVALFPRQSTTGAFYHWLS